MTEHRDWFSTFKSIPPGTWAVTVVDDRELWVHGIGNIKITRTVDGIHKQGTLQKVLYIPELRRNLFSIGVASKAGLSFQTLGNKCALYRDLGKGPKVMEGVQIGTLYRLSITHVLPTQPDSDSAALAIVSTSDAELVLWHNRMGHVNTQLLKDMSTHGSLQDFLLSFKGKLPQICRGCAFGKQHKASYPSHPMKDRSDVPGELLHADLCGKMSQPSLGNAYYYILIKDDYTSFRFIVFLN
jgi:hypothetical protein